MNDEYRGAAKPGQLRVRKGKPPPLGASATSLGTNFSLVTGAGLALSKGAASGAPLAVE